MKKKRKGNVRTCQFCSRDTTAVSGVCHYCRIHGDEVDTKRRYYYAGESEEEVEDTDRLGDDYHGLTDRDDL